LTHCFLRMFKILANFIKDHPLVSMIGLIGSIASIYGVFFIKDQKPVYHTIPLVLV
jgi:hypothetical protein